jgi:hypothetical protein
MRQAGCKPGRHEAEILEEKTETIYGKDNRVLLTEQIPEQHDLGSSATTGEGDRVLPTGQEIGLSTPTNRAFASLDETAARKLREELEALWSAHNRGGDELTVISLEYLEVIAVKA